MSTAYEKKGADAVVVMEDLGLEDHKPSITFADLELTRLEKIRLFLSKKNPIAGSKKPEFFFWNPPGRSSYENRLVLKLDFVVLTYVCLSFFVKYLDASNISNAYVSGMKEDLNMSGDQYNWLGQGFSISYSICGLFGTLLITKFPAHVVLPAFEILWSLMTLLVITCNSYHLVLALRVIQGALSGLAYPAANYIMGSWYTPSELNVRTGIFVAAGSAGGMFGGYIQSGVNSSLSGKGGLPGWKWIFVIDFIIGVPIAIFGYFVLPGDPVKPRKSFLLGDEDFEFCRKRVQLVESVDKVNKFDFSIIKRVFTSWQFYIFGVGYIVSQLTEECTNYWGIALEDLGYSTADCNNIPTIQPAVKIVSSVLTGFYCDIRGKRWEVYLMVVLFWISGLAVCVAYDVPKSAWFYGNSILGVCAAYSVLIVSWANEMCKEDDQLRAAVLGSFNLLLLAPDTPYALHVWNTDNSPKFHLGFSIGLGFACALLLYVVVLIAFDRYQNRLRDLVNERVNNVLPPMVVDDEQLSQVLEKCD